VLGPAHRRLLEQGAHYRDDVRAVCDREAHQHDDGVYAPQNLSSGSGTKSPRAGRNLMCDGQRTNDLARLGYGLARDMHGPRCTRTVGRCVRHGELRPAKRFHASIVRNALAFERPCNEVGLVKKAGPKYNDVFPML